MYTPYLQTARSERDMGASAPSASAQMQYLEHGSQNLRPQTIYNPYNQITSRQDTTNDVPRYYTQNRIAENTLNSRQYIRGNPNASWSQSSATIGAVPNQAPSLAANPNNKILDRQFDTQQKRYEYQMLLQKFHHQRDNPKSYSTYRDPSNTFDKPFTMDMLT